MEGATAKIYLKYLQTSNLTFNAYEPDMLGTTQCSTA